MSDDEATRRTDRALEVAGLADMRPAYRKLLVRLKRVDPAGFEEATRRYREDLEPAVASADVDPLAAWLEYGRWIAERIAAGRAVAIDTSGRARPLEPQAPDQLDSLVIHLPDDERASAIVLATPREPSQPQRVTADLLVR